MQFCKANHQLTAATTALCMQFCKANHQLTAATTPLCMQFCKANHQLTAATTPLCMQFCKANHQLTAATTALCMQFCKANHQLTAATTALCMQFCKANHQLTAATTALCMHLCEDHCQWPAVALPQILLGCCCRCCRSTHIGVLSLLSLQADVDACNFKGVPPVPEVAARAEPLKCYQDGGPAVTFGTSGSGKCMPAGVTFDVVLMAAGKPRANYPSDAAFDQVGVGSVLLVNVAACVEVHCCLLLLRMPDCLCVRAAGFSRT
jgi:hypothetical protein